MLMLTQLTAARGMRSISRKRKTEATQTYMLETRFFSALVGVLDSSRLTWGTHILLTRPSSMASPMMRRRVERETLLVLGMSQVVERSLNPTSLCLGTFCTEPGRRFG